MAAEPKHFDVIVIGSGGGMKLYKPASLQFKLKTALCEKGPFGGTCLNRGCIPSKMLIHPAEVAEEMRDSSRLFFRDVKWEHDWKALVEDTSAAVDSDSNSIRVNLPKNPHLTHYAAPARFIGPRMLQCGDEVITGDRIFIAAGSRPSVPEMFEGLPYMTSTEALRLTTKPKSLVVVGGGYIACELAFFYGAMGVPITMIARSSLLRHEDGETAAEFTRVFTQRFNVKLHTQITSVRYSEDSGFTLETENQDGQKETITAEQCLVATGVVPNSDLLDLEKAGIKTKKGGFIDVDPYLRTSAENVWALGDIAGNYLFRHSVNFEGEYLYETVLAKVGNHPQAVDPYPVDYTGMPHAVFSYPQVAGVGETEEELKARNASYVKGVNPYKSSAMGMALRSDSGFVKILVERGTRKLLGVHIVGREASTLIHEVLPIFRTRGSLDDILYTVHIHPALSELVRNAARKARDALVAAGDELPLLLQVK